MTENVTEQALSLSMDMGEAMLECGADVHRVEQTISLIGGAYGADRVDVFSINSMVLATVQAGEQTYTQSRRVTSYTTDLDRLEDLNSLSRRLCGEKPPLDRARRAFARLGGRSGVLPALLKAMGYVFAAGGFCVFFGGRAGDCLVSMLIAVLLWLCDRHLRAQLPNRLIYTAVTAAAMGILACLAGRIGLAPNPDKVMIGDIMLQIPGLVLINGLRDMLLGDTMTGCMRVVEAVLTALAIALGFAVALMLFHVPASGLTASAEVQTVSGIFGTLGFSLLFSVKMKRMIPVLACGALTAVIYECCTFFTDNMFLCFVIPAIVCGLVAESMARIIKAPTTVFLLPGLVVLLPGNALYYTMAALVQSAGREAVAYGTLTVQESVAIAMGVVASSILTIILTKIIGKMKKRR